MCFRSSFSDTCSIEDEFHSRSDLWFTSLLSGEVACGQSRPPWKSGLFCETGKDLYKPISFLPTHHTSFYPSFLWKAGSGFWSWLTGFSKARATAASAGPAGWSCHAGNWILLKCCYHTEHRASNPWCVGRLLLPLPLPCHVFFRSDWLHFDEDKSLTSLKAQRDQ